MKKVLILLSLITLLASCTLVEDKDVEGESGSGKEVYTSNIKRDGIPCSELEGDTKENCIIDYNLKKKFKDNLQTNEQEDMKKEVKNDAAVFDQKAKPVDGDIVAEMKTNNGTIMLRLFKDEVPTVVNNFIGLASEGYYDGIIFHRVINNFMIQGGDPTGTGMGGKSIYGEKFDDEFSSKLSNIVGSISMANSGPDTNGSQFFINQQDNTNLDYNKQPFTSKHAVFGQVYEGYDNVTKIAKQKTDTSDKPVKEIKIISLKVFSYKSGKLVPYKVNVEKVKSDYIKSLAEKKKDLKSKKISDGNMIEIHYVGKFEDGTVFDTSRTEGRDPLAFEVGAGTVIPGMDKGVKGLMIGEKKTITIEPKDGYGEYDKEGIKEVNKKELQQFVDNGLKLEVGEIIFTTQGRFLIKEVKGDIVKVDFNHELAGKTLIFDIEIMNIKK